MSDLVERVAREVCADAGFDPFDAMANDGPRWRYYEPHARAAIKAVAEWIAEDCETVFNGGHADVLAASNDLMRALSERLLKQAESKQ